MKIVAFLQDILPALSQLAALTSTTLDDSVVDFVRLVITNPTVAAWLQSLIDGGVQADSCHAAFASPEVRAALADRRIDWNNLVTNVLPKVLKLVALLT